MKTRLIASTVIFAIAGLCIESSADEQIRVPVGQRQLFMDDDVVAQLENLRRTMHQPLKKGAVIKPDQPWESVLQTRCAPAWDAERELFKIWLVTSNFAAARDAAGTTYAESKDGIHWTKPALRQVEYNGSLENNYVTPDPQLRWGGNAILNVVYDPDDKDPQRRFKGMLGVNGRQPIISPDGIHWKLLDAAALPSQDESNLSYDRANRMFLATLKETGPYGRSHGISTSKDFMTWTKPVLFFHADAEDQQRAKQNIAARLANPKLQQPIYNDPQDYHADIYNIGVFRYEGLYIGLPAVFHSTGALPEGNTDGFHLIQLVSSRDLKNWHRLGDRQPFIEPSEVAPGVYDTMQMLPPSSPVQHDDELRFYYTGIRHRKLPEGVNSDLGAICLAVLRRDGFISLDAGPQGGQMLTKPFTVRGQQLLINADARNGDLTVEILDRNDNVLAVSEKIEGDQLRATVQWRDRGLAEFAEQPIRLRFRLRQASLYSFWLK